MTARDATLPTAEDQEDYRLPYAVSPRRYDLHLSPDLDQARFSGTVGIELEVHEEVDRVVCNADELQIAEAELAEGWASAGDPPGPAGPLAVELDPDRERVSFVAGAPIPPGRHTLRCRFSGVLNDRLRGFYRSTFVDDEGATRVIATTQFEETSARMAFPCFDEPDRKAVFSVVLDAPAGTIAISNGPERSVEELPGGVHRVRFGETVPMSTYLVAFVVGPLELTEARDAGGIPVRVAHLPGRGHLTRLALESAEHALGFYASYFEMPYPGEKLDLVALPDFAAGAMENLGCVTFREAILLADPDRVGRAEHERLAEVVDHELAHMWFGDLVTMRWWNGIWLNEAFATFMALLCSDDYRPEWEVFTSFARSRAAALGIDGLHSTRPIEFPVRAPEEAAAMFDVLTYEKGAAVLWMLQQYLGADRFRAGVRRYLAAHAYANTETTDLWDALGGEAPDVPVREVMESWLLQGGHPLVTATPVTEEGGAEAVELAQAPFAYLPAGEAGGESAIGSGWLVPVIAAPVGSAPGGSGPAPVAPVGGRQGSGGPGQHRVLLAGEPARVPSGGGPLVVNAGGTGFYRLRYAPSLQEALLGQIERLSPLERFDLIGDAWATTLAGLSDLAGLIELLGRLRSEEDPHVWSLAVGALGLLDLVVPETDRGAVRRFSRALLAPHLARLGWEPKAGEGEQPPLLRATLVSALGLLGQDEAVVARAAELFAGDHFGGAPLDPDLAGAVLGVVAAHAGPPELGAILERYRHPRDPMDGIRHLYSLGRLGDPDLASEVLELTLGEIRSQNAPILIGAMLSNREIGPTAFAFVRDHFEEMRRRFPENLLHRMLEGVTGMAQLDEEGRPRHALAVRAFCEQAVEGPRRKLIDQSLERLEVNVRFAQRVRGEVGRLLSS